MKATILFLSVIAAVTAFSRSDKPTAEPIVVAELFTSQGCSSCPPAERLLSELIDNTNKEAGNIFALSFHVDYWNRLGWKDPFSDKLFSDRQSRYADAMGLNSIYTPQLVINGHDEFTGSNSERLENAIQRELKNIPQITFEKLTAVCTDGQAPQINYTLNGNYENCKINFALISLKETTEVKRGENGGRILTGRNYSEAVHCSERKQTGRNYF
jgi:hypothetical protein